MRRILFALVVAAAVCCGAGVSEAQQLNPAPVQVMILGVYHFGNPGRDLADPVADDVTAPRRQQELEAMARALLRFRPTRIAVEADGAAPDLSVARYTSFTPDDLHTQRNETVQIGFRLAHDAGLSTVSGIDEDSDTVDYFPFGAVQTYAAQHNMQRELDAWSALLRERVHAFQATLAHRSISQALREMNDPRAVARDHIDFNYGLFAFGDTHDTPGADLNAAWYLRNARIFAHLRAVARPGDRVIVVFGAGHAYWLRHFVETAPGFALVEPNAYLPR